MLGMLCYSFTIPSSPRMIFALVVVWLRLEVNFGVSFRYCLDRCGEAASFISQLDLSSLDVSGFFDAHQDCFAVGVGVSLNCPVSPSSSDSVPVSTLSLCFLFFGLSISSSTDVSRRSDFSPFFYGVSSSLDSPR